MDNKDLSISELMAMPDEKVDEMLIDRSALRKIGCDERHVRVVLFHVLRKNWRAIENFSLASERSAKMINRLTLLIVALMVVQVAVALIACL
jgi:hypothetical protein